MMQRRGGGDWTRVGLGAERMETGQGWEKGGDCVRGGPKDPGGEKPGS